MITINIDKARAIAHDVRRAARTEEFKPFDDAIAKQIPGQSEGAEAQRVIVREKYTVLQAAIDSAKTVDALKALLP